MSAPIIRVEELTVSLNTDDHQRNIIDSISFDMFPKEIMGLVGESGSGKTMTALSIMQLLPKTIKICGGSIWYEDKDLLKMTSREIRTIRGNKIAMIFQNPRMALNPLMRVGDQIARAVCLHCEVSSEKSKSMAVELMSQVGIPDAESRARSYPHQLSGGMAQRVLIAMMLACKPKLLIADEPTTGLDVTIQAQIFKLIKEIQSEIGVAVLLITHDFGVVSEVCDRVGVMYAGQIMEISSVIDVFTNPKHPYTQRLLKSILRVDRKSDLDTNKALSPISAVFDSPGCRFASQCDCVRPECLWERPKIYTDSPGHSVYCFNYSRDNK
ncbi:MAG: ABC transporter ATP-binding protein [Anaerolineales bacterium]|nr:ABC transporter ATP-binding protein [Anaerolineales bacterium]